MRLFLIVLTLMGLSFSAPPFIPPGWHNPQNPHYGGQGQVAATEFTSLSNPPFTLIVFTGPVNWATAAAACRSKGLEIASIHNLEENMKVLALLKSVSWQPGVWKGAWIGLTDDGSEGRWRWADGSPVDFLNFGPGEPNGGTYENYGAIELARAGRPDGWWNDANVNEKYGAVVCRGGAVASVSELPSLSSTTSGFQGGDKVLLLVDSTTCPAGDVVKDLSIIKGSYECVDFQGKRWIKPFDAGLNLYKPLNISGDFSLEFEFYTFEPGCPFVAVNLFPERTLKEAQEGNQYALGGDTFIVLKGSCDRFEAGVSSSPRGSRDAFYEYKRNIQKGAIHSVALAVRNGKAIIYLDGNKIASEPFTPTEPIRGIGFYFYKHYETDKPYGDFPALIGNVKLALYTGAPQQPAQMQPPPLSPPQPQVSLPKPQPPPPPAPIQPFKKQVKCIESVGVGEASVIGGDRASAKAEALARAKWDAIEKALGVTTSVKTIVQNFQLLDEVIKNQVGGFIKDVKVLQEENFADMVRVKVRGCVYPEEAERALSLISSDTAFSVMVIVKNPSGVELDEMNPVTTELVNILNQQGFKVYDFAGNPNVNPYDVEQIVAQKRFILLRAYMSRALSGAMVVGKVELVPSTQTGQDIGYGIRATFNVVTARLNYYLLARDADGLRIVASGSLSAMGRAPNLQDANYKAMEALAQKLGSDIMGKIERYRASKKKVVTVVVKGVKSTSQNFEIKEKLQRVPWVESVEDLGLGKFKVTYLENTVYLANAIERMPELKLIRFSPTEVEASSL
ncbi:lectin-like protein [Hydrogenivirga caldilitoris]|uniref:Lectin-like protein n=1 Tax=Hydrogenivirga caldilitoris TaxID=246264 RepID=A0A497XU12_9AQUI|nr:C-type lectin domain-containing protein [Hydrogenivirga caldilitoris]RLJ70413.1 lectin-like protein [Hydrogenivirga caldilitoris]